MSYILSNIAGFVLDRALHNPRELICSRFVVECMAEAGNPLVNPRDRAVAHRAGTPADERWREASRSWTAFRPI